MKLYFQFLLTLLIGLSFRIQDGYSEILGSEDDAIVIEALTDFQNKMFDPKSKMGAKLEGRTEDILETTIQPSDAGITNIIDSDSTTLTTLQETEIISEFTEEPGTFPWLAEILKNGKHFCAGSLIDHRHILTTAYCIFKMGAVSAESLVHIKVDIGFRSNYNSASRDLYEGPSMSQRVKKVIYHRHFNVSTAFNDIALLQLEHPVMFDKLIQPISIVEDIELFENSLPGFQKSIVGWKANPNSEDNIPTRGEEILIEKSIMECRRDYVNLLSPSGISDSMLCAGGDSLSTTCYWAFGSPLLARPIDSPSPKEKPIQIGFFSWGIEALLPKCKFSKTDPTPMVFTRISSYTEWIRKNLKH